MAARRPFVRFPDRRPVTLLTRPISAFVAAPASSGITLLLAAAAAVLWANSPGWRAYELLWQIPIGFVIRDFHFFRPLAFWINDAWMAVFFLLVGLEIKRELSSGELASVRRAALPIAAALGGVLAPALIYAAFNHAGSGRAGWGIPMATDIAFVAGVLAILGSRVPTGLAVFLTALAIVDDLFAVIVIAIFYTKSLHWLPLALALAIFLVLLVMNRAGIAQPLAYFIPGVLLWAAVLASGVHATIAGVLLAVAIPGRRFLNPAQFVERGRALIQEFERQGDAGDERQETVELLGSYCRHVEPPLHRMEWALRPWVSFLIMPLFAFANAGVRLTGSGPHALTNPVTAGVLLGLFLGKPAGILFFSWLAVRLGIAAPPAGVDWRHIHGAAWLAGIGFTMSLFVGHLAFGHSVLLDQAKVGIFAASLLAGFTGSFLLLRIRTVST